MIDTKCRGEIVLTAQSWNNLCDYFKYMPQFGKGPFYMSYPVKYDEKATRDELIKPNGIRTQLTWQ